MLSQLSQLTVGLRTELLWGLFAAGHLLHALCCCAPLLFRFFELFHLSACAYNIRCLPATLTHTTGRQCVQGCS